MAEIVCQINHLITQQTHEEKVAALLLSHKLFQTQYLNMIDTHQLIGNIIKELSIDYLVNLVLVNNNSKNSAIVRRIVIELLGACIRFNYPLVFSGHLIVNLTEFCGLLISLKKEYETATELMNLIKYLVLSNHSSVTIHDCLDRFLRVVCSKSDATESPLSICPSLKLLDLMVTIDIEMYQSTLGFVVDLVSMLLVPEGKNISDSITQHSTAVLRLLLMKGFHGANPESIRDFALKSCLSLFSRTPIVTSLPSSRSEKSIITPPSSYVFADWSVEFPMNPSDPLIIHTPEDQEKSRNGQFALLLISIINVEIHLLLEETIALVTPNSAIDANSEEKLNDNETNDEKTSPSSTSLSNEKSLNRMERVVEVYSICLSLLNVILVLLVGNEYSDVGEFAIWAQFPYETVLKIRQTAHSIFQNIFNFTTEVSERRHILKDRKINSDENSDMLDAYLRHIVQLSVQVIGPWVNEDEGIHKPFVDCLHHILSWSSIPTFFNVSNDDQGGGLQVVESRVVNTESLLELSVEEIEFIMSLSKIDSEGNINCVIKSLQDGDGIDRNKLPLHTSSETKSDTLPMLNDVSYNIFPCLEAMIHTLPADGELTDTLCSLGSPLICRIINTIVVTAKAIVSRHSYQFREYMNIIDLPTNEFIQLNQLMEIATSGCNIFTMLLTLKLDDICVLRRSESDEEVMVGIFSIIEKKVPLICANYPPSDSYFVLLKKILDACTTTIINAGDFENLDNNQSDTNNELLSFKNHVICDQLLLKTLREALISLSDKLAFIINS